MVSPRSLRLLLGLTLLAGTASTALAAEAPTVHVKKAEVKDCNTDGGRVKCDVGVKTVAKGLFYGLEEQPIECDGVKPGVYKLDLVYEYNDGTVLFHSHQLASFTGDKNTIESTPLKDEATLRDPHGKKLRKLPNLPACVREAALPRLGGLLLRYIDTVRQIDPDTDVRATYSLQLEVR